MMMTAYWTEIKTLDKTRYCARLLEQAQQWFDQRATTAGEHDVEFSLFFVTGIRYSWEIEFFEQALLGSAAASGYPNRVVASPCTLPACDGSWCVDAGLAPMKPCDWCGSACSRRWSSRSSWDGTKHQSTATVHVVSFITSHLAHTPL
jgi:hypothetical protein